MVKGIDRELLWWAEDRKVNLANWWNPLISCVPLLFTPRFRFPDERESTVSTSDIVPSPKDLGTPYKISPLPPENQTDSLIAARDTDDSINTRKTPLVGGNCRTSRSEIVSKPDERESDKSEVDLPREPVLLHRSTRLKKSVDRLNCF